MAYGILLENSYGTVQIDETYRNLVVVDSGTETPGNASGLGGTGNNSILWRKSFANVTTPILAVYGSGTTTNVVTTCRSIKSGSSITYDVYCDEDCTSINYFLFDVASAPTDIFGVQVYNASGDSVFHSSQKPLRVAGLISGNWRNGTTWPTLSTDRVYAIATAQYGHEEHNVGPHYSYNMVACSSNLANPIRPYLMRLAQTRNYNDYNPPATNYGFLIVDVTNY